MVADLLLAFSAGALSFFAPCVVPLVPAYVSYLAGVALPELRHDPSAYQARLLRGTGLYVLGFAAVFVALGIGAGIAGGSLRSEAALLQRAGGVLVVLMGLALAGVLPASLTQRELAFAPRRLIPASGPLAPLLLGIVFGAAWTPCVGPVLAAILVLAASTQHALSAAALLLAYAAGIGLPFVVVSLVVASFPLTMSRFAHAGALLSRIAGGVLVLIGLLLVLGLYPALAGYLAAPFTPGRVL